jgi:hypothetical protein
MEIVGYLKTACSMRRVLGFQDLGSVIDVGPCEHKDAATTDPEPWASYPSLVPVSMRQLASGCFPPDGGLYGLFRSWASMITYAERALVVCLRFRYE